jgi:hypothetical protein
LEVNITLCLVEMRVSAPQYMKGAFWKFSHIRHPPRRGISTSLLTEIIL